ncbi:MAG: glycosyltransferase family 2 protein [Alphaproteobacteria bacterium]|nr:glycosyltransferase family 2 protein [Alphaproteobacteria bacterium]
MASIPKVSIVIPVYNVEEYIKQCLDSIVNQTLQDIEIIVVNDCSPANEDKIIQEFAHKDSRIKYIKLEKNVGQGEARNIGLSQATGEYFYCADSDDYLDLTLLEKAYNKAKSLDADMLFFQLTIVDCKTGEITPHKIITPTMLALENKAFSYQDTDGFFFDFWGAPHTKIYKKEFYKQNINYPNLVEYEDAVVSFNGWLKAKRIAFINECLYYYRINRSGSITYGAPARVCEIKMYISCLINIFNKENLLEKYKYQLMGYLVNMMHWRAPNKEVFIFIRDIVKHYISKNELQSTLLPPKSIKRLRGVLTYPFWYYKFKFFHRHRH